MSSELRDQGWGSRAAVWAPSHTCAMAQGWYTWKFLLGGTFFALSPGNCCWVRYSLQPLFFFFCLFPAKEKLKSPEQVWGWDFKGCYSCTALWHAAMCPWCKGSKRDMLGVFQGRKHRGILHLTSAALMWSPGRAHLDSQTTWRDINLAAWS